MDRLIEETLAHLPQVFIEREIGVVREEMTRLNDLSDRFRTSGKVCYGVRGSRVGADDRTDWNSYSTS